jgi:type I restriction enzyme M protein
VTDQSDRIVKKLWSYCQVLRDDGLSYQDYLEQLTFLLFLKMADERADLTGQPQAIPAGFRWADLANPKMEGVKLEQHYRDTLRKLGEEGGRLGLIFSKAQSKFQDPAKLRKLVVDLIGNDHGVHAERTAHGARGPRRVRRVLPRGEPPPAQAEVRREEEP